MSATPVELVLLDASAGLTEEEIAERIERFVTSLVESTRHDSTEPTPEPGS